MIDRDKIRALLVGAGAPAEDLDWLVASCPSERDAERYRAPPRDAWCFRCDGVTLTDREGCVPCRGRS